MAYRCKTYQIKECDGCGECQERGRTIKKYGVTITLEEMLIEAESAEEAKQKAISVLLQMPVYGIALAISNIDSEELSGEED